MLRYAVYCWLIFVLSLYVYIVIYNRYTIYIYIFLQPPKPSFVWSWPKKVFAGKKTGCHEMAKLSICKNMGQPLPKVSLSVEGLEGFFGCQPLRKPSFKKPQTGFKWSALTRFDAKCLVTHSEDKIGFPHVSCVKSLLSEDCNTPPWLWVVFKHGVHHTVWHKTSFRNMISSGTLVFHELQGGDLRYPNKSGE